jgi:hypothetical protein
MFNRLPGELFQSTGDRCLQAANRIKLDVCRIPGDDDDPPETCIEFELHGCLDSSDGDAASLVAALITALGKGGAA